MGSSRMCRMYKKPRQVILYVFYVFLYAFLNAIYLFVKELTDFLKQFNAKILPIL